jgi:hypothetical protein
MGGRFIRFAFGALLASLAWPVAVGAADEVTVEPSASARVKHLSPGSALVQVRWSITCLGPGTEGSYSGSLTLVDEDTGEEIYMGGISTAAGDATQLVERREKDRRMKPRISARCSKYDSNGSLFGSDTVEALGDVIVIPAKGANGGGGNGGGGHGGGGGGSGGADPDDPLGSGGCANELHGSAGPDVLNGEAGGDLILALGGADRVRGGDGHDCLVGGSGGDRLLGEDGYDRLTGGSGADRLDGGPGRNAYDAGPGDDRVKARNGRRETVRCGPGEDTARADANDRLRGCEHVARTR